MLLLSLLWVLPHLIESQEKTYSPVREAFRADFCKNIVFSLVLFLLPLLFYLADCGCSLFIINFYIFLTRLSMGGRPEWSAGQNVNLIRISGWSLEAVPLLLLGFSGLFTGSKRLASSPDAIHPLLVYASLRSHGDLWEGWLGALLIGCLFLLIGLPSEGWTGVYIKSSQKSQNEMNERKPIEKLWAISQA